VIEAVRRALESDPHIAYALVFGSTARGTPRKDSDLDVALGIAAGLRLSALEIGDLASRLEAAAGRPVDLVLLDEAPPGLAYRVFRDGQVVFARDRRAMTDRKARAILEYLDFRPVEEACTQGVLAAAARGR
jgi:hypothetical protein